MANKGETSTMDRIFGGAVVPTLFKLALLSVLVGLIFAVFGIDPMNLWRDFGATIRDAWTLAFDAVNWSWQYAALGAIVRQRLPVDLQSGQLGVAVAADLPARR